MPKTIWRSIPGFARYEASTDGDVRIASSGRIISQHLDTHGYPCLRIRSDDGRYITKNTHRMIAIAFLDPAGRKETVNHIDGNRLNNRASNLEWATQSENLAHAYSLGLRRAYRPAGEKHHCARLTEADVLEIRSLSAQGRLRREIARQFGVSKGYITNITRRYSWAHIP
jgi:hypothetical protein